MTKRKSYGTDNKIKDNAVLLIAPFVIWCLMVGFVTLMVYVTE